ncbi:biotin--[acetyl-CoA-carboxylase] ligase [Marinobacter sp. AL4B]|uniref:biotin--[acetyl-CoA-carboxylase] ligase n=1 Tax=Marinobacter sp. AL4B TaxID=2871173 RepID=UPI001CAA5EA6|nr:biotin--[acetyl-CoA-carboxylase] ligase [Marinobacter sp. AL4B]MBZ0332580.1 biotin--[acetyl-CoA-carboxylase] ligase [Marinobacter sp. AL4B]
MKPNPLLDLLSDHCVHSGESLAKQLGVSRTAVWKQIRKVQAEGVEIKTIRGQGYQLVTALDLLDRQRIVERLVGAGSDKVDVMVLKEVDSTNAEVARRLAAFTAAMPVVLADAQTEGRGRRGRNWSSPKGQNLYLSMGLTLRGGFEGLSGLSLVLGVAVIRALNAMGVSGAGLKWPNDLYAGGKKFGGILVEIQGELQEGQVQVIAGLGINVHMTDAVDVDQPWTSLAKHWPDHVWVRNELAALVILEVGKVMEQFQSGGFSEFRQEWQGYDIFFGQALTAKDGALSGTGGGVDAGGNYMLDTNDGRLSVMAGDISLRVSG